MILTWLVGARDEWSAIEFMKDLADRLGDQQVQITTDAHKPYLGAVEVAFGGRADYAQLIKEYGRDKADAAEVPQARKYSPNKVTSQEVRII